jgi:hypothetical protein
VAIVLAAQIGFDFAAVLIDGHVASADSFGSPKTGLIWPAYLRLEA